MTVSERSPSSSTRNRDMYRQATSVLDEASRHAPAAAGVRHVRLVHGALDLLGRHEWHPLHDDRDAALGTVVSDGAEPSTPAGADGASATSTPASSTTAPTATGALAARDAGLDGGLRRVDH